MLFGCPGNVSKWKQDAGRKNDWRAGVFIGLVKSDHQLCPETSRRKGVPFRVLDLFAFPVAWAVGIPRDMLRRYQRKQNAPNLTPLLPKPHSVKKGLRAGRKDSRSWGPKPWNSRKPYSQVEIQNTISEGIASVDNRTLSGSEAWDADMEDDDAYDKSSASVTSKVRPVDKTDHYIAGVLTVPYASYIGAIISSQFVLRGFLDAKACYDVHAAKNLHTGIQYTARVYTISGTKGKDRDSRLKNLKRNAAKASCIAYVDQDRRKWLLFPAPSCPDGESANSSIALPWQGEQQYKRQFPSLAPHHTTPSTTQRPLSKSYASCLRRVQVEPKDRVSDKKRRARDRQRRKRKEERAAKAAMRENPR